MVSTHLKNISQIVHRHAKRFDDALRVPCSFWDKVTLWNKSNKGLSRHQKHTTESKQNIPRGQGLGTTRKAVNCQCFHAGRWQIAPRRKSLAKGLMLSWNASRKNHKIIFWGLITESSNGRDPVWDFRKIPTVVPSMESQLSECSFSSRFNNSANSVKEQQTLFPLFIGNRSIRFKLKVNITTRFPWEGCRLDPVPFWEVVLKGFNIMMEREIGNRNDWLFVITILWRGGAWWWDLLSRSPLQAQQFWPTKLAIAKYGSA